MDVSFFSVVYPFVRIIVHYAKVILPFTQCDENDFIHFFMYKMGTLRLHCIYICQNLAHTV